MGTDIHVYYEVWEGEAWRALSLNPSPSRPEQTSTPSLALGREHDLFAVLAGVRNGLCLQPIDLPRGFPDEPVEEETADCHDASWFTLDELLTFDWDQPLRDLNVDACALNQRLVCNIRTYRDAVADSGFLTRVLPHLQAQVDDPRHLRMVFWFDN